MQTLAKLWRSGFENLMKTVTNLSEKMISFFI
jgi:hypothetical protein